MPIIDKVDGNRRSDRRLRSVAVALALSIIAAPASADLALPANSASAPPRADDEPRELEVLVRSAPKRRLDRWLVCEGESPGCLASRFRGGCHRPESRGGPIEETS